MELKSIKEFINIYDGGRMSCIQQQYSNLFNIEATTLTLWQSCIYDSGIVNPRYGTYNIFTIATLMVEMEMVVATLVVTLVATLVATQKSMPENG